MLCVRSVSLDVLVSGFLLSMEMYKFLNIFLYITAWDKLISSNKEWILFCSDFAFLGAHIPGSRQMFGWLGEGQVSCIKTTSDGWLQVSCHPRPRASSSIAIRV